MKIKTFVIAFALTAAPTLSLAAGCNYGKQEHPIYPDRFLVHIKLYLLILFISSNHM